MTKLPRLAVCQAAAYSIERRSASAFLVGRCANTCKHLPAYSTTYRAGLMAVQASHMLCYGPACQHNNLKGMLPGKGYVHCLQANSGNVTNVHCPSQQRAIMEDQKCLHSTIELKTAWVSRHDSNCQEKKHIPALSAMVLRGTLSAVCSICTPTVWSKFSSLSLTASRALLAYKSATPPPVMHHPLLISISSSLQARTSHMQCS